MAKEKTDIVLEYPVQGMDFQAAGQASSNIKHALQLIGFRPDIIRRAAVVSYEAEMNIVIHASQGTMKAVITPGQIEIIAEDSGPGIPNTELAMQEGFSTAPDHIRELGFGAGMGLPNIKKCSDIFNLETAVGKGTTVRAVILPESCEVKNP